MVWPWNKRKLVKRWVRGEAFCLAGEVRYIQGRAAIYDNRKVTIGYLLLFSSETGDAWLLDPADHLAALLANDGAPLSVDIEDDDPAFTVHWMGSFRIEGDAFIYRPNKSRKVRTIFRYPTRLLMDKISHGFG